MRKVLVALACVSLLAGTALADDLMPPPWRDEVSTTLQWWHFGDPRKVDIPPDGPGPVIEGPPYQAGFLPSTKIIEIVPDPTHPDWYDLDPLGSNREGIWALSGWIDVIVDNHDPENERKLIRVQVTWAEIEPGSGGRPVFVNLVPPAAIGPVIVDEHAWPENWKTTVFEWQLDWNPPDEAFRLQGDILIDQLVIDTWCIPEPGTMAFLGLGGLGVLIRRRRRQGG